MNDRAFVVENYDPIAALSYWRRGELGLRPWLASLRTVDETAWFARDDLRPFGLMCLRMGWRLATRPLGLPQGGPPAVTSVCPAAAAPPEPARRAGRPRPATQIPTERPAEPRSPKEGTRV